MDIKNLFVRTSEQLLLEFQKTSEIQHSGGKGDNREDAFRGFLKTHLPTRYAVGRGEIVSHFNDVSPEMDVVIYDPIHCPLFLKSDSHSIFPTESVYGAINMKSHLDSGELKEAYSNISSFKKQLIKGSFYKSPQSGFKSGMSEVIPVTGVVAYSANRSVDAIQNQVKFLDSELDDLSLRPDFIAIIGTGIIGPRKSLRGQFNRFDIPNNTEDLTLIRKTGRHTLLRIHMQLISEMNKIELRPLNLEKYLNMPLREGKYKIDYGSDLIRNKEEGKQVVIRINEKGIDSIVKNSKKTTRENIYLKSLGTIPIGLPDEHLKLPVFEYNPRNLPPISDKILDHVSKFGRPPENEEWFSPIPLNIDGHEYSIDMSSIGDEFFYEVSDMTVDELMGI